MVEHWTRMFVLVGYLAVALNSYLILNRCSCSRYRRYSLHAIGAAASFWTGFYVWLEFFGTGLQYAPEVSRIGHTVTVGAFMVQQFMIQSASQHNETTLEQLLGKPLKEPEND